MADFSFNGKLQTIKKMAVLCMNPDGTFDKPYLTFTPGIDKGKIFKKKIFLIKYLYLVV